MAEHHDFNRFEMPSVREIELDLALASPSWQSLLRPQASETRPSAGTHAIVIGGSMAGLMAARVLSGQFDRVTIVDRDTLPPEARFRDGVPQSRHLHALLRRGLDELELLFPGIESELVAAGAVRLTTLDFLRLTPAGWARRFDGPALVAASRELIEWTVRRRTLACPNVRVLHQHEVAGLLGSADSSSVTGVHLSPRRGGETTMLHGDFVVDASGRGSKTPEWLDALGYQKPKETVINSFLGYSSCAFAIPSGFRAGWKVLMVSDRPPDMPRAGVLAPIEGNRWMVSLGGYGRDYPPTDREGFMEFARSLRSDMLHRAIKDAEPVTRVSGFRSTMNRRRHFDKMERWPERFLVVGDAACAFNPIYGQGMSVAAITAGALQRSAGTLLERGSARRMQAQVAAASMGAWVIATGADVRYPTTVGRQPGAVDRIMQRYLNRVVEVATQDALVNEAFIRVVNLLDPPTALMRPAVAWRAVTGAHQPILEPPISLPDRALKPAHA